MMCLGDKLGRLGRHNVLRPGRALVLGLGLLCRSNCCEFTFNIIVIIVVVVVVNAAHCHLLSVRLNVCVDDGYL